MASCLSAASMLKAELDGHKKPPAIRAEAWFLDKDAANAAAAESSRGDGGMGPRNSRATADESNKRWMCSSAETVMGVD